MSNTVERVIKALSEVLAVEPETLSADTVLEDLDADSLDMFETLMELEVEFDIEVPDEALLGDVHTIGDVAKVIDKFIAEKE